MIKVSVIIPNFNGEKLLPDCLNALKKQHFQDFEVILVDNGSADLSIPEAIHVYPELKVVRLERNTGFAHAVNEGIRAAKGEYVILLNNDTIPLPGFVGNQYKMIKNKSRIFSCSALMIQNKERELVDDAGDEFSALGWGFAPDRDRPVKECAVPHEVFSSCAGAAIYRKSALEEIGLFDESFFAYLEDMDVGCRARLVGYINMFNPYARVYHIGSASTGSRYNAFKVRLSARNSMYLVRKNLPRWQRLLNLPFLAAGIVIKAVYFNKKGLKIAYLQGIKEGLTRDMEAKAEEKAAEEKAAEEREAEEKAKEKAEEKRRDWNTFWRKPVDEQELDLGAGFVRKPSLRDYLKLQKWLYRGGLKRIGQACRDII